VHLTLPSFRWIERSRPARGRAKWLRYTTAPAIHADDRRADAADGQLQLAAKSSEAILRW